MRRPTERIILTLGERGEASVDGSKRSRHLSGFKVEVSHRLPSGQGRMEVLLEIEMYLSVFKRAHIHIIYTTVKTCSMFVQIPLPPLYPTH